MTILHQCRVTFVMTSSVSASTWIIPTIELILILTCRYPPPMQCSPLHGSTCHSSRLAWPRHIHVITYRVIFKIDWHVASWYPCSVFLMSLDIYKLDCFNTHPYRGLICVVAIMLSLWLSGVMCSCVQLRYTLLSLNCHHICIDYII